jgi:cell division protein FtsL
MSTNTMINWKPENIARQLPWGLDRKAALGFLLILATFSLVGWLYLTQASAVTTTRYRIDELRLDLDQLHNQNATLALEIAQLENLNRIQTRARELGMGPTTQVRYLVVPNYPVSVKNQADKTAYVARSTTVEAISMDDSLPIAGWWMTTLDKVTAWIAKE